MKSTFDSLADELLDRFRDGRAPWAEGEFEQVALRAFAVQFDSCDPYRAFCLQRGSTPDTVSDWRDVPSVPATAFKYFDFRSGPEREPEAVFETSGTTRGSETRGRHPVPRLDLYRASLAEPFRLALLPDVPRLPFLSLIPSPEGAPRSSLSFMVGEAAERFATEVRWLVDGEGRWSDEAEEAFADARDRGYPVLVLGTAAAFARLLEDGARGPIALPAGSRAMETGGFKGVGRELSRAELYAGIEGRLGIHRERIVNEYGMTELLSQLYEPVLTEGHEAAGRQRPPPWLRVRALDPTTLAPLGDGEEGVLCFFDLANLGSICHVLTEDIGTIEDGRVLLRGRVVGSEPRGCSRAMDELMTAHAGP